MTPHPSDGSRIPPSPKKLSKPAVFYITCTAIALTVFCIANVSAITAVFQKLGDVLAPVIIGCVIAYLCNPFLNFYEYVLFRKLGKGGLRRALSLLLTVLTALGLVGLLIALIIPQLYQSISQLFTNYEFYLNSLLAWVQSIIDSATANLHVEIDISDVEKLTLFLEEMFGSMQEATSQILSYLQGLLVSGDFLGNLWAFLGDLFNTFKNLVLGLFIAFYILSSKEKRLAQIKKFRAAYFSDKQDQKITEVVTLAHHTFGGFIKGVLLDSLAVGVVTYILLSVCRVSEYNLLIATICAVTNIIPVFGPFIGAIPSGLIVLISNPDKFILFLVLVILIQQLDGNILCPIIQGNNTGVSSLAVLIAITVMGGFFDLIGMVIGVPVFAVIIELGKRAIEERLEKRGRPTDTTFYYSDNAVGNAEKDVYYEHAHWKYVYDHSRIKPHVDKVLAAVKGKCTKKAKKKNAKRKG